MLSGNLQVRQPDGRREDALERGYGRSFVCTGALVSAQNHFLTNNHCVSTNSEVDSLRVRFDYERTTCGGTTNRTFQTFGSSANTLVRTNAGLDFTLLTLAGNPVATYGYLPLNGEDLKLSLSIPSSEVSGCPHQPPLDRAGSRARSARDPPPLDSPGPLMDPISHALFAKTLHALDERGRFGPGAAAAFVAGSLLPDVDIVRVIQGWDVYLARHEVETHTLLATPIEGAALALVLYRFLRARGRAARLFPLALAATIGAITHVFLDLANGSDMKIFHPVADLRMGWHLMAMWEPVVVSGLVLTHLLAWRHPRLRQRLAGVFLAVFAVFLFAKAGSQRLALAGRDADRGELMRVEEVRGSFSRWRWFVRERESGRYEVYDARAFGGAPRLAFTRDPGGSNETITATLEYPVVRHLHAIGDMPLVWMEAGAHPGDRHVLVHWSDMEFCGPDRCFMTFGVAFDGEGTPLYQFVDVGGLRQRRAAARHERFALSSIE